MSLHSSILQSNIKGNTFQDNDQETRLEIVEQPKSRGFRFRYNCEGPSHGGVPGASSDKNKKTYPSVKIANYHGYARIVVQLVTNEENPRLHPHSLVGKQCQNGICTVQCGPRDMVATFPNLGIQHVTKKNVASILEERYIAAENQLVDSTVPQDILKSMSEEDRKRITDKAQTEAKQIDLSIVRLMFIAYLPDCQGAFTVMLEPVISNPIFDSKAPNASTLKICRIDCQSGSALGGDEVYLLCDKVQKDDIQVRFVEEDMQGNELWEDYGNFSSTDVHRQFAIVFKTPSYRNQAIQKPVHVNVQLRRKSDGETSEPRSFTYTPIHNDFEQPGLKRKKVASGFKTGNSIGYNFGSAGSVSPHNSYSFQGSPNSTVNKIREARPPPVKQENPQKCPLDPSMLFKINSVKQEPKSPQYQGFGSRHSSFQGSERSSCSPMSESTLSSGVPSPPSNEPQYFPGTQIPMPKDVKVRSGIPAINFQRPPNAFPSTFQNNNVSEFHSNTSQQNSFFSVRQEQQVAQTNSTTTELQYISGFDNQQYNSATVPRNNTGTSPIGDVEVQNPGWTNMQTVTTENVNAQFMNINEIGYDQNHNQLPVIHTSDVDIVEQAINAAKSGPGSGSLGLASVIDPLMPAPQHLTDFISLQRQLSLNDLFMDDMFDIESDAVKGGVNGEEVDFASALYDPSITSIRSPSPMMISSPASVQADCDVESDTAILERFQNLNVNDGNDVGDLKSQLSLQTVKKQIKQASTTSANKPENSKVNSNLKKQYDLKREKFEVQRKQNETAILRLKNSLAKNEAHKMENAKKMATAIHDYSVSGDVRILLVLQRHLAACVDDNGDTSIHLSVIHNQMSVLSVILDVVLTLRNNDEIVNRVNKQQQTALQIAVLTDNMQAVKNLLRAGADPLIPDLKGNHAIHVACRHGNADILKRLLNNRLCRAGQFDVKNHSGYGCFHQAVKAKKHNLQCLRLLKEHEANVDMVDGKSGKSPLHVAVELNNLTVVGCLVSECNVDLESSTYDGLTPLHLASSYNRNSIARLLISCGANVDASTRPPGHSEAGETPRDLASSDQMRDILNKQIEEYEDGDEKLLDKYDLNNDETFWSLDSTLRNRLCNLLNEKQTGSDWIALADQLDLNFEKTSLEDTDNPAYALIKAYEADHGTCDGLRTALMSIGRHDAVQVLNKALNHVEDSSFDQIKFPLNEDLDERNDSAIGSMPA